MIDVTNAQIRRPSELVKSGNKEMIKNMIEKTTPKDFSDDFSVEMGLDISDIILFYCNYGFMLELIEVGGTG